MSTATTPIICCTGAGYVPLTLGEMTNAVSTSTNTPHIAAMSRTCWSETQPPLIGRPPRSGSATPIPAGLASTPPSRLPAKEVNFRGMCP